MENRISLELDGHKVEFGLPEGYESTKPNENQALVTWSGNIMFFGIESPYTDNDLQEENLITETETWAFQLRDQNKPNRGIEYNFQTRSRTHKHPEEVRLKNHKGCHIELRYFTGGRIERYIYLLDKNTVFNMYFIYYKIEDEIANITNHVASTIQFIDTHTMDTEELPS